MIEINGRRLELGDIAAVAAGSARVALTPTAIARMTASQQSAIATSRARPVYGRSTGVGANRSVLLPQHDADVATQGLNLLRSHAVDAGQVLDKETIRAMLVIRLSQLAAGSSGINPAIAIALAEMLNTDSLPEVREYGGIGTADLPALAGTALTLLGERPLLDGSQHQSTLDSWDAADALPFISSNALTIAQAALAQQKLATLLENLTHVSALSFIAMSGNPEAFSPEVASATETAAVAETARVLWALVEGAGSPARIQDPYCLRTLPLIIGSLSEELIALKSTVERLAVAGHENPLVYGSFDEGTNGVAHHGLFEMTILAKRTDAVHASIGTACATILRRISLLCDPAYTGLNRFLASDRTGTSGVMMLEYVAAAAAGHIRSHAPASHQTVVLSLGAEDDASFASVATSRLPSTVRSLATIIGIELICAARALRLQNRQPDDFCNPRFRRTLHAGFSLPPEVNDRDLRADVEAACAIVLSPIRDEK